MIYYIGGLQKEFHHVKVMGQDEHEEYQPAIVIIHPLKKGRSFMIPLQAMWKYVDPKDNADALFADIREFSKLAEKAMFAMKIGLEGTQTAFRAKRDLVDIQLASALFSATKILPTVSYNLVKCLRMFDITVCPQSAAQLLLWIQDGLDELKNMPDAPLPEGERVAGEVTLWEGGQKIATRDVTVKESDLMQMPASQIEGVA